MLVTSEHRKAGSGPRHLRLPSVAVLGLVELRFRGVPLAFREVGHFLVLVRLLLKVSFFGWPRLTQNPEGYLSFRYTCSFPSQPTMILFFFLPLCY